MPADAPAPRPGPKPKLPAARKNTIGVRASDNELAAFQQAASKDGLRVSEWLRYLGRKAIGLRG